MDGKTEQTTKTLEIGKIISGLGEDRESNPVIVRIEIKNKDSKGLTLSICGDIMTENRLGSISSGQCDDTIKAALDEGNFKPKDPFTTDQIKKLINIWDVWHLNDMNAACKHQRALKPNIIKLKGKDFFNASNLDEIYKVGEFKKCSKCGYRYGSAWLHEPLPEDVIEFIHSLEAKPMMTDKRIRDLATKTFLKKFNLKTSITYMDFNAPQWAKDGIHGNRYKITIKRTVNGHGPKSISFDFWGSNDDASKGIAPSRHDVLSTIAIEAHSPTDPDEVVQEYGEMPPSRAIIIAKFAQRLQNFFTEDELNALREFN